MNSNISILLVATLDKSANADRAKSVFSMLQREKYNVVFFNTQEHFAHMLNVRFFLTSAKHFVSYLVKLAVYKIKLRRTYPIIEEMYVRGSFLHRYIQKAHPQLIICQNPQYIICLLNKKIKTIYDAPSLFSELLQYNGFDNKTIRAFTKIEDRVLLDSSAVTFQWPIFHFQAKLLNKKITNEFSATYGCSKRRVFAAYSSKPKVVYLGNMNAPWINPNLLNTIVESTKYQVDLYGYEPPEKSALLENFHGYLRNLDAITKYQFGIITADRDIPNFSAKYLLYISYGLPVLCPEWRKDAILKPATIYYNERNFDQVIGQFGKKGNWERKHLAALKLSRQLSWEKTLQPFRKKVRSLIDTL